MTKDDALKLALEALEGLHRLHYARLELHELNAIHKNHERAITAIKQALATPAPEPRGYQWLSTTVFRKSIPKNAEPDTWVALYTTPPAPPAAPVQEPDHGDELTIAYMSGVHRGKELAAQHHWVGLNQPEIIDGFCSTPHEVQYVAVFEKGARWAEVKLKEKNHD